MIPTFTLSTKSGKEAVDVISAEYSDRNIYLTGEVTDETAVEIISQLHQLDKTNGEINLWINSPGGSVSAGLAIVDCMNHCKNAVNTIATGIAASMGSFLLACGKKRFVTPNVDIMIHQPLGGGQGQASDVELMCKHMLKTKQKLNKILAEKTGKSEEEIALDTDRNKWFSAEEAVAYGLADQILE